MKSGNLFKKGPTRTYRRYLTFFSVSLLLPFLKAPHLPLPFFCFLSPSHPPANPSLSACVLNFPSFLPPGSLSQENLWPRCPTRNSKRLTECTLLTLVSTYPYYSICPCSWQLPYPFPVSFSPSHPPTILPFSRTLPQPGCSVQRTKRGAAEEKLFCSQQCLQSQSLSLSFIKMELDVPQTMLY